MDELSKLKQLWQDSFNDLQGNQIDDKQLSQIIKDRSTDPIQRLKKSIYFEIASILLVIPLLVAVIFALPETYFIINTLFMIALFSGALIYYYAHLKKITRYWEKSQENLRTSLQSTIKLVKFFRKTYFILNIVLFPLGIYFGYIIGFGLGSGGEKVKSIQIFEQFSMPLNLLIILVGVVILFLLFLVFLKFYVRKLYDVHINKLEKIYTELLENE